MLGQLFKTYVRPVLHYGLEVLNLKRGEIDHLETMESNMIKLGLGLPNRIHSKNLLLALRIDAFTNRLKLIQTSFYARLFANNYTRNFINELHNTCGVNLHKRSLLRNMSQYMVADTTINNFELRCKRLNSTLKAKAINEQNNSATAIKIRKWLTDLNKYKDNIIAACLAFI